MGMREMDQIAIWIRQAFEKVDQPESLNDIQMAVKQLTSRFPLYPGWSERK
jgi:glycine hydroxymethyltransferase